MSGGIRLMAGGLFGARGCSARGAWLVGIVALLWWNQQLSQPLHCPVQHSLLLHDGLEVVVHLAAHLRLRNGVSSRVGRSKAARGGKDKTSVAPTKIGHSSSLMCKQQAQGLMFDNNLAKAASRAHAPAWPRRRRRRRWA